MQKQVRSFTAKNSTTPVRVRPVSNWPRSVVKTLSYPLIKASTLGRSPKETAELREKRYASVVGQSRLPDTLASFALLV
jgi:hypothetical protein